MIAVQHTVKQMYGEAMAREAADLGAVDFREVSNILLYKYQLPKVPCEAK